MTTATDTDIVILEALDFDVPLVCEKEGCDTDARWVQRFICCGRSFLKCEDHRLLWVTRWNAKASSKAATHCGYCRAVKPHWRDLVEFIPIEARS